MTNLITSKRIASIELMRFIAILYIMAYHMYHIGYEENALFKEGWIFVEFFYIVTGFFVAKHFNESAAVQTADKPANYSIKYTLNKFKGFIPYIIIAVSLEYLLSYYELLLSSSLREFLVSFINMPFEMMLLSSSGMFFPELAPIWYLSAMFLTMPVLCYVLKKWHDLFMNILCWLIPVIYYGCMTVDGVRDWPHDMLRAFSCMALGCFVYVLVQYIKSRNWNFVSKATMSAIELAGFLIIFYMCCKNWECGYLILLLFVAGTAVMLSEIGLSRYIRGDIFIFLGKISLPMFLFHWMVGTFVNIISDDLTTKIILYYTLTILISIVLYKLITYIKIKKSDS